MVLKFNFCFLFSLFNLKQKNDRKLGRFSFNYSFNYFCNSTVIVTIYTNQLKQPISAITAVINIEHTDNKNNLEKSLSLPFSVAILLEE